MAEWIGAEQELPEPWRSVRVQASGLEPETWQAPAPDGEYEGFYDDEEKTWNCYTLERVSRYLYRCNVAYWKPLPEARR